MIRRGCLWSADRMAAAIASITDPARRAEAERFLRTIQRERDEDIER